MVLAQEALVQLKLDSVLLMPMGQPPHRRIDADPGAEVRAELCEAAVAGDERMEVSRIELEREGPSYTVDTLIALREERPGDELFWILGGDQAAALHSWHQPEKVLELCTIGVTERAGWRQGGILLELRHLRHEDRLLFFEMPAIAISSTMVRRRAALRDPIRYLVPDGVAELIESRGLYGADAAVGAS
jgi:nicotinate-nucleotide adenylyltransferase